ncbi:TPA: hypothetical protein ACGL76_001787 [Streptococcus agalactiae]
MNSFKTIGIIGGGQLGQMMAIAAIYMGHKVITLDPASDCPASRVSEVIVAPYDDVEALGTLAARCDVLTYEFENVDADGLDAVMFNVLGQHVQQAIDHVAQNPSAHLHMYGKLEAKHNRKMGHVTVFSDVPDEVEEFEERMDF